MLTLDVHVSVCVCVSVKSHLTLRMSNQDMHTWWYTMNVKKIVGVCLGSRVMPQNMTEKANMLINRVELSPLDTQ